VTRRGFPIKKIKKKPSLVKRRLEKKDQKKDPEGKENLENQVQKKAYKRSVPKEECSFKSLHGLIKRFKSKTGRGKEKPARRVPGNPPGSGRDDQLGQSLFSFYSRGGSIRGHGVERKERASRKFSGQRPG